MADKHWTARLSALNFFEFWVMGSTAPVISLYFREELHLSGAQMGWIMGIPALSALLAPVINSFIADRIISSEKLLGICHLIGGGAMLMLALQTQYTGAFFFYLLSSLMLGPTVSLANAVVFHHTQDNRENFGSIRVFGTLGWIAVAWFSAWAMPALGQFIPALRVGLKSLLYISMGSSFLMALFCFTLPDSRAKAPRESLFPVSAVKTLMQPSLLVLLVYGFILQAMDRFYYMGSPMFFKQLGIADHHLMPLLSLGQIPEILFMAFLSTLLRKMQYKWVFILGAFTEALRFALLSIGGLPCSIAAILCHGAAYTLSFIPLSIYLDHHCDPTNRAGVHLGLSLVTAGFGNFLGSYLSGLLLDPATRAGGPGFTLFWAVPAIGSFAILLFLAFAFRDNRPGKTKNA